MAYDVKVIDLTNAIDDTKPLTICPPQKRIAEIVVLSVPGGASFRMRVGQGNPFFTVDSRFTMEPDGNDANDGLFIANATPQAGVNFEIIVVYGKRDKLNTLLS